MQQNSSRNGLAAGLGAYFVWGLLPAFFGLLAFAAPMEIVAHRVVWTLVVMIVVLAVVAGLRRRNGDPAPRMRDIPLRAWLYVAASAGALAINWGVYAFGVTTHHVVECALGYFIVPLVSVLLGVVRFRERLTRAQGTAVGLACLAVAVLTVDYGRPPMIALVLAFSFGVYGMLKKLVPLDPLRSISAESVIGFPIAFGYLGYLTATDTGVLAHPHPGQLLLLLLAGPVTVVPLLLFSTAAQRIPLTMIGILQYLTPILQMVWGVSVTHESMSTTRWAGFALIWCALTVFTTDALHRARTARRIARAAATVPVS